MSGVLHKSNGHVTGLLNGHTCHREIAHRLSYRCSLSVKAVSRGDNTSTYQLLPTVNVLRLVKRLKKRSVLHGKLISEPRDVTCHMGSHSLTCHPTQVNTIKQSYLFFTLPTVHAYHTLFHSRYPTTV